MAQGSEPAGARTVVLELVAAGVIFALGALVVWESRRLGSSWGAEGPQAGYFPFYIGLLVCVSATVVFARALLRLRTDRRTFVTAARFRQVLVVLLPAAAYVLGVQLIGVYVSSAVFIAAFMRFAGKYSWLRSAAVGLFVSLTAFMLSEIWFKLPLPKGPLERLIGY